MKKTFLFLSALILLCNCKKEKAVGLITEKAMVVSARKEASKIGSDILQKGGNAFDAMIATELALAVAYPYAGNLGGGGFMVYRKNTGEIGALDYREKAPLASHKDMYLDSLGNVIKNKSTLGAMAVGVPGTVAGVFATHKKFGSLPIQEILKPVIALAKKGVIVTQKQEDRIKKYQHYFLEVNKNPILFDKPWKKGDTIKYPALAKTLERISQNGRDEFYKGETAKRLVTFMQANGGIITEEDLAKYEAKWRTPITFTYDNLRIISMSPPASGGICLAQIMNGIEPFDLDKFGHNSTKSIQVITEAERRAYADRSFYLGDPDFVKIPIETLKSKEYTKNRMNDFSFKKATSSTDVSHGSITMIESDETTHYSIVDQFGNAISATTTINGAYGSKLYCSGLGFFLNNEMDDFSSKPGVPNMFGLVGAEANKIEPEKRMLSSMTPTIVEKNGQLHMVVGTPGGSTIITSVLQTILNVHEFDMGMQEAVNQTRFHHQWLPDVIKMEPKGFNKQVKKDLQQLGYKLDETNSPVIGKVDAILVLPNGKLEGGADPRGDDTAIGF
ncbi:gamma-glutamyltransferase [Tenacibaculum discolor]|uniref:Glutathione hydrolase proenzyme n=1 Tax=Tenacibaculum discolor TaxID=361581 RepID=A0A2G1BZS9_9FLAO|nr:gamma-glutamyltransferase [Tenacibaculum discolor]MDP2541443.1 gamma-glutamyltransferase [Tenacibaculum discolor]PHN99105.1 gamma-glutamyltransferase [Tenacibaculum discolor]PHO01506.1 gamma-glutamyltransferase [Rhodobacteraceae bacterium 4F10]